MIVIGDVHGKLNTYFEIIKNHTQSICVGDFGFKYEWDKLHKANLPQHKINMGNHDYYPYLYISPNSLGDWSYTNNIFTVRGADSIDKHLRREGFDWFSNEELTYQEGYDVYDNYVKIKPEIVITHDCPQVIMITLFGYTDKSITRQLLQHMFEVHQPKLWLFGHHHKSVEMEFNGTTFRCLAELETTTLSNS